uniref:Uncharacterized protein n=1 Tax=uncultured prokaryote TaxID=198431 RepID=A0A0H5Q5X6_9ZZZZ|nr:hypothetical protein [uncultured prokaryote]
MAICLYQVIFSSESGLPEDQIVNTFHFEGDAAVDPDNPVDMLFDFYKLPPAGGGTALIASMPGQLLGTTMTVKGYDLEEAKPRVPFVETTTSISPSVSNALPGEVAMCLSFQAAAESGQPQARRRNRVYLGPFIENTNVGSRPTPTIRSTAIRAARDMLVAANASINWKWVVYSPTTAAASSPSAAYWPVQNGWVDNAWDSQRRRGWSPTTREIWTATIPA